MPFVPDWSFRIAARFLRTSIITVCAVLAFAGTSVAAVVNSIVVEGNTRLSEETIKSYLTITPGVPFGTFELDASIKALFETGLFDDVDLVTRGSTLVVVIDENPVINKISFEGNKKINDDILKTQVRLEERSVYTRAGVQADTQRLLEVYRRAGRFRATVEPEIIQLPQNRVNLVYTITEGPKTEVARITFIGNRRFSDTRLRDLLRTRETGLLGFLRTTDSFDPDRLNSDQELLRRFYFSKGYADFRVISAVADLDRERNVFFITFTVDEGEKYEFADVDVQTSLTDVDPEQLLDVVRTKPGQTYNSDAVERSMEDLSVAIAGDGYAFSRIRPRVERDFENRTISLTYFVDEGPRAFVERIRIRGNTRTRDFVIRREFDFAEGDAFNRILLDKAERRLNELRFFESVKILTERGSAPDQIIITVLVEEKSTGELSFGAGYSTADGIIGDISISERNLLGRGQFLRVATGVGETTQNYELTFREPYFLGRRINAGFSVYRRTFEETDFRQYEEDTTGGSISFILPLRENFNLTTRYEIFQRELTVPAALTNGNLADDEVSLAVQDSIGETLSSIVGYSLIYDTRDRSRLTRDGFYVVFSQDFAGLGGDVSYVRTQLTADAYKEIWPDQGIVGALKVKGGYIRGIGERLRLPDHFFKGGETIRGFEPQGIGPRDATTLDPLGGRVFVAGTAEVIFPVPLLPKELGFTGAVFADVGTLYDPDPQSTSDLGVTILGDDTSLRASAGVSILWDSPLGPLRADFGFPLLDESFDEKQLFRIGGGTQF
ncbi:MAG: outer membrane protein assembly factor BamA [Pseudomonadota bacterium]